MPELPDVEVLTQQLIDTVHSIEDLETTDLTALLRNPVQNRVS